MRLRLFGFLLVMLGGFLVWAFPARSDALRQPYELTRTLQALQAQVANGNVEALQAQRALLLRMEHDFLKAPAIVWQDPRNARAAVIHALSGGHPDVMRELVKFDPLPNTKAALLKGALAYGDGLEEEAAKVLASIDPRELPPSLGGHVALVQATVTVRKKPEKAKDYLGLARLLMPGTLVEEAALRREVFVAGKLNDLEGFRSLSIRYLKRYRQSLYAADFIRRFALAIDALEIGKDPDKYEAVADLLKEFRPETQRNLYRRLARTAVLSGELTVGAAAATEGLRLAKSGSRDETVLKLYLAAASVDNKAYKSTRSLLWSIDKAKLNQEETALLETIYSVFNSIRDYPAPPKNVIGEFTASAAQRQTGDPDWVLPIMAEANRLLEETDVLLAPLQELLK
jgi:chemotaxis protein MotC